MITGVFMRFILGVRLQRDTVTVFRLHATLKSLSCCYHCNSYPTVITTILYYYSAETLRRNRCNGHRQGVKDTHARVPRHPASLTIFSVIGLWVDSYKWMRNNAIGG